MTAATPEAERRRCVGLVKEVLDVLLNEGETVNVYHLVQRLLHDVRDGVVPPVGQKPSGYQWVGPALRVDWRLVADLLAVTGDAHARVVGVNASGLHPHVEDALIKRLKDAHQRLAHVAQDSVAARPHRSPASTTEMERLKLGLQLKWNHGPEDQPIANPQGDIVRQPLLCPHGRAKGTCAVCDPPCAHLFKDHGCGYQDPLVSLGQSAAPAETNPVPAETQREPDFYEDQPRVPAATDQRGAR